MATMSAFSDELEKIAFMANVGSKIVSSGRQLGKAISSGWHSGNWVGNKGLTVGMGALSARDAIKKEDPSGEGRSSTERLMGAGVGTAAGLATMKMGFLPSMAIGIGSEYGAGRAGRLISGRKAGKPQQPQSAPVQPQVQPGQVQPK